MKKKPHTHNSTSKSTFTDQNPLTMISSWSTLHESQHPAANDQQQPQQPMVLESLRTWTAGGWRHSRVRSFTVWLSACGARKPWISRSKRWMTICSIVYVHGVGVCVCVCFWRECGCTQDDGCPRATGWRSCSGGQVLAIVDGRCDFRWNCVFFLCYGSKLKIVVSNLTFWTSNSILRNLFEFQKKL